MIMMMMMMMIIRTVVICEDYEDEDDDDCKDGGMRWLRHQMDIVAVKPGTVHSQNEINISVKGHQTVLSFTC